MTEQEQEQAEGQTLVTVRVEDGYGTRILGVCSSADGAKVAVCLLYGPRNLTIVSEDACQRESEVWRAAALLYGKRVTFVAEGFSLNKLREGGAMAPLPFDEADE